MIAKISDIFKTNLIENNGVYVLSENSSAENQAQTNKTFTTKWEVYDDEYLEKQKLTLNWLQKQELEPLLREWLKPMQTSSRLQDMMEVLEHLL